MEQPFYIGQKVVRINCDATGMKLGEHGIVIGVYYCCSRYHWRVHIEGRKPVKGCNNWECDFCLKQNSGFLAINFAPLQEGFEAITFERVMEEEKVSVN